MPVITHSIDIAAAPERVFGLVSDLTNELKWNPEAKSITKEGNDPIGMGTVWQARWKRSPLLEVTVTDYQAPQRIRRENGGALTISSTATVDPTESGARLTFDFSVTPKGIGHLFVGKFVRLMSKQIPENMQRIKEFVEAGSK